MSQLSAIPARPAARDRARFVGPSLAHSVISRERLDHAYAGSTGGILRVLAPAGYGKSTQVTRWIADDPRHSTWVDLEPIDNDPAVLAATLSRALAPLSGRPTADIPIAPSNSRNFADHVVPALAAAVSAITEPFVLVLDDVHEVTDASAGALIDAVAANVPPASTVVLIGRAHRVDGAIGRLRLHPGVTDVLSADLALDSGESTELLASMGVVPMSDDLASIVEQFAGWPAGLRLAGLAMASGTAPTDLGSTEVGRAAFVTDYLRSEWTATLAPDDVEFLRGAACLGRFQGDVCDEVLDTTGSAARLRRLHRDAQLVLPLDLRDQWYRMHPVLAQWLESELRDLQPERWREIERRAALVAESAGDIDLAIHHASRIDDADLVEQLVTEHGPHQLSSGMYVTVGRWLSIVPMQRVNSSVALCSLGASQSLQSGDRDSAYVWTTRLGRIAERASLDAADRQQAIAMTDLYRAMLGDGPPAELAELACRAAAQLVDGQWNSVALWAAGGLFFVAGDARARQVLDDACAGALVESGPQFQANCTATAAIVAELTGGSSRHRYDATRHRNAQRTGGITLASTAAPITAMNAIVAARSGDHDVATDEMAVALAQLDGMRDTAPWFNVVTRLALARAAALMDDPIRCRAFLRDAESCLGPDDAPGAREVIARMRAAADTATARHPTSNEPLTAAELRVLDHLPTNLSLAEIAKRLFVSRNTVKTHAAAIYRKFGASSRGEAVDLARQAGILQENRQSAD